MGVSVQSISRQTILLRNPIDAAPADEVLFDLVSLLVMANFAVRLMALSRKRDIRDSPLSSRRYSLVFRARSMMACASFFRISAPAN
jgi:hypothetical protein